MMSTEQWIGFGVVMVILMLLGIAAWLVYHRYRPIEQVAGRETDTILDAIDGVRDQVDSHSQHTALEHEGLNKKLDVIGGRTQWLVANDIAAALAEERKRAAEAPKSPEEG